jgi:hypothetical protein
MGERDQDKTDTHLTIVAWVTYFLSSSTALSTSSSTALASALMSRLRFTRIFLDLKPSGGASVSVARVDGSKRSAGGWQKGKRRNARGTTQPEERRD